MSRKLLLQLFALVACLLCSMSAAAAEAYACYVSSDHTLTFYYDNLRSSRSGTTYSMNTGENEPGWLSDDVSSRVTYVLFDPSFANYRPTSTAHWFSYMRPLTHIEGINYLNTSQVTNMRNMFCFCVALTSIDVSGFNTSNVTDMRYMFYRDNNLHTIYAGSGWSTASVTASTEMFIGCTELVGGNGTSYDENHVDKAYARIDGGPSNPGYLTAKIEAYACYTPSNTTLTFYYDNQRSSRSGTTYDMNDASHYPGWRNDGTYANVTKVVFNSSFAGARPISTRAWFFGMSNLTSITGLSYLNTEKVTNMMSMFEGCSGLTSLDLKNFETGNVTIMTDMFYGCSGLTSLNVSGWYTANVMTMASMFYGCSGLTSLDLGNFNTSQVISMNFMFSGCSNLKTIYAGTGWSTDSVTMSTNMFSSCTKLVGGMGTTYSSSHIDATYAHIDGGTSNPGYFTTATEAYACFNWGNTTLTLYYDNLRATRSQTDYDIYTSRFYVDDEVQSLVTDVVFDPSFAGFRPTRTALWFANMYALRHITGMKEYLNTSEVTDMSYMFKASDALTSLDLSGFNTAKVTDMESMFRFCSALTTIYVGSGWTTNAVISSKDMFYDCTSLVGGQGTTYSSSHIDKAYAHIDGGTSNPGYFTDKNVPVAYACYTPSNTTLTFYYDTQRSSRTGTTYDLNDASSVPGWRSDGTNANVTKVVFNPSFAGARPTSTYQWFSTMTNLTSITGLSYLNTENVTTMMSMFYDCKGLTSLDLSNFNTDNVTKMSVMFSGCSGLTSLDVSGFNTSKVTNMSSMFWSCTHLTTIYAGSGWTTNAVTSSGSMFYGCTRLVGGMGTTWDESNPKDKTYARIDGGTSNPGYFTAPPEAYACYTSSNTTLTFYYDSQRSSRSGTTYDLNDASHYPGWRSDGTYANVTKVVFNSSFAGARPISTREWFYGMSNLTSITGLSYLNTVNVTTMTSMFRGCTGLTSIDVTGFNTSNVTSMQSVFSGCSGLSSLDVTGFNTSKVTNMQSVFWNCTGLTSLDLSNFNTSKVTNMMYMFSGCTNLKTISAGSGWTTNAVTTSSDMFYNCTKLVGGMGTTWNSSNPTDKTYAHIDGGPSNPGYFTEWKEAYACYTPSNTTLTFYCDDQRSSRSGTTYDLNDGSSVPGWRSDGTNANVTKVVFNPSFANARPTSTYQWFSSMTNLTSITGLSYLNTENVTTMQSMFFNCKKLTSLDVSGFNTSNVTDMLAVFNNCSGLTSLDVSGFNTSNVTSIGNMFSGCSGLTSLDLSSFNTSKVTNMMYMFYECTNLTTIYAGSGWTTNAVTSSGSMFYSCTSLVGGMGTTYDASHTNKAYAHIDGGTSNPGYFTVPPVAYACYTPSNTTLTFYYDSQRSSRSGTTYDLNDGSSVPGWKTDGTSANVTKVVFNPSFANARPISARAWFSTMTNLTSITGLSYLNTENMTNMSAMFYGCTGLTSLDVSHFNTSKVVTTMSMFYGCTGLTSLDLSNFNTSKATNMSSMFKGCSNLETIYAGSGWTTNAVTTSSDMFLNCTRLVGGMGTTYNSSHVDATYAHIDGGTSNPGYFTAQGLRGDVNGDGSVTIIDVTAMIDYLLTGNSTGIDMSAADVNQDSDVTIIDVTALIDYLLTGSW